ncbi:uncharacterized protein ACWYII_016437 isoform 1-T2 [Salvelinus alpinus]
MQGIGKMPWAHWFLAVICFPGLDDPQHEPVSPTWLEEAESDLDKGFLMDYTSPNPMSLFFRPAGSSTRGRPGPAAPDCDFNKEGRLSVCSDGRGGEKLWSAMKELSVCPTPTGPWSGSDREAAAASLSSCFPGFDPCLPSDCLPFCTFWTLIWITDLCLPLTCCFACPCSSYTLLLL